MWTGKVKTQSKYNTATTKSDTEFMYIHIFFMYVKYK